MREEAVGLAVVSEGISSAESLRIALVRGGVLPLAADVALAAAALALRLRRTFFDPFRGSEFRETAIHAAPLAAALAYGLIWAANPWQVTPGNPRAAWPLFEISLAIAPVLIAAARTSSKSTQWLVAAPILAGLAAGIHPEAIRSRQPEHAQLHAEHAKLQQLLHDGTDPDDRDVCVSAGDIWPVFEELAPPLFLERKTWFEPGQGVPEHCDVLVIETGARVAVPGAFRQELSFTTIDHVWRVYRRSAD